MEFRFGSYVLDIDIQKTKAFYQKANTVSAGCDCLGCRNYEKAVDVLPSEIKAFFDALGIDMKKPAEVWTHTVNADGSVSYGGFYHLCGKLLCGESAWVLGYSDKKTTVSHWDTSKTYLVSKDLRISFQEECDLVEDNFPEPILQMEIEANIPWVLLDKPSDYFDISYTLYAPKVFSFFIEIHLTNTRGCCIIHRHQKVLSLPFGGFGYKICGICPLLTSVSGCSAVGSARGLPTCRPHREAADLG